MTLDNVPFTKPSDVVTLLLSPENTVFVDISQGDNAEDRKITVTGGVF